MHADAPRTRCPAASATRVDVDAAVRAWGADDQRDPFPLFAALRERFPRLRPAVPLDELQWTRGDGVVLRGLASLPVVPGPTGS